MRYEQARWRLLKYIICLLFDLFLLLVLVLQEARDRRLTRGRVCDLIQTQAHRDGGHGNSSSADSPRLVFPGAGGRGRGREEFWKALGVHAFSLAPAGHGLDTHRLWEILSLRSVPIVLSSPLDRLYATLPVVMVRDWAEVFREGALGRFRADIQRRFGEDPFANPGVLAKLASQHWVDAIRTNT